MLINKARDPIHHQWSSLWWCHNLNPHQMGILYGRIQIIETYVDALNHVTNYRQRRMSDYRDLIRSIAQAKCLGKRVGEEQHRRFSIGKLVDQKGFSYRRLSEN